VIPSPPSREGVPGEHALLATSAGIHLLPYARLVPQVPTFHVGVPPEVISVSPPRAQRIVEALKERSPDSSAAKKIEEAMKLGGSTTVELGIGEDEDVLEALANLREEEGDVGRDIDLLDRALRAKIAREP
jgi:hypothetical protein